MKNDNAFPRVETDSADFNVSSSGGLTKRELFAAMAMQGMLSNSLMSKASEAVGMAVALDPKDVIADGAVNYADALIAELEKATDGTP